MSSSLPKFEITGSDYFQILLDKQMLRHNHNGNVGRLFLELDIDNLAELVQEKIKQDLIQQICQLSYKKNHFFAHGEWSSTKKYTAPKCIIHHTHNTLENYNKGPYPSFNQTGGALFQIDVFPDSKKQLVVFSWHHALLDARGAESLALYLCGLSDSLKRSNLIPSSKEVKTLTQLQDAKIAKTYIFEHREWNVTNLYNNRKKEKMEPYFFTIKFDETETKQIESNAKQLVRFGKSPFYLAATSIAFSKLLFKKDIKTETLMIPVPQDQRLKGANKPILSNQVSYLFYRLKAEQLQQIKETTQSISQQMMEQIKQRIPHKYKNMMSLFRKLPLFVYNHMSKGPTKGKIASFYFSDTGESLNKISSDKGKLIDATHFPPAALYPGFTIIFMKVNDRLKAVVATSKKILNQEEIQYFDSEFRKAILDIS